MINIEENNRDNKAGIWIQEIVFLVASFVYMLIQFRPTLILEIQSPVFFLTSAKKLDWYKMI